MVVTQIPTVLTDPNFETALPNSIDYAELSIYRDLDLLAMKGVRAAGNLTPGVNSASLPTSIIAVESAFAVIQGVPQPLTPASQDFILAAYAGSANGTPQYYAITGLSVTTSGGVAPGLQILIGPPTNVDCILAVYCSQRALPLSATNTTTFISQNMPDLFWAAAMIFWSGYLKNFGAVGYVDDPQMSVTWSKEYARLLKSADVEQARLKFQAPGWQAQPPTPLAQART